MRHVRASGNQVGGLAPAADFLGVAAGVMVHAPCEQAEIAANRVDRDEIPSAQVSRSSFSALLVDQPVGERLASVMGNYAAVRMGANTLVLADHRAVVVAAELDPSGAMIVRGNGASVVGNTLAARGITPAVQLTAAGDCVFSDNRCELRGNVGAVAVQLEAAASIVNGNRVRGGRVSIQLTENTPITAVGNITTGIIAPSLAAPWDALNVIA